MGVFKFCMQDPDDLQKELDQMTNGSWAEQCVANQAELQQIQEDCQNAFTHLADWQKVDRVNLQGLSRKPGRRLSSVGDSLERLNQQPSDTSLTLDRLTFDTSDLASLPDRLRKAADEVEKRDF
jgi:hypothetical protein